MRRLILCLALAGCTAVPQGPAPEVYLLRNPTAPLGSQVDVSAAELSGTWIVRQAAPGAWPGEATQLRFRAEGDDLILLASAPACTGAGSCVPVALRYRAGLPGRWGGGAPADLPGLDLPAEFWVLWTDADRRTLVLGDPDGRFAVILDRAATGGADRIAAARRILESYGYDLSRLSARG